MRWKPFVFALLCAAVVPADSLRDVLATTAATLFEAAPFVLAARALASLAPRYASWAVPMLGCGCGGGPAARSIPALAATWLAFGPAVAFARFAAAFGVARVLRRSSHSCDAHAEPVIATLSALLPYGALAGVVAHLLNVLGDPSRIPPALALPLGAIAGFALAPCGLGVVGVAGALRASMPAAAIGFLCVAGIADIRALSHRRAALVRHDAMAYALAAAACALAAWHGGATLLHPRFVIPLWCCAAVLTCLALRYRNERCTSAIWAPLAMAAGVVLGAPPPSYHATATTLADAFAGESLTFTGVVTREGRNSALVRYAITCCRADAAPVVVRISGDIPPRTQTWVRASGTLVTRDGALALRITHYEAIAPPRDPFIYR
jgi:hypothetical protein